jgi:hypothetical protein
LIDYGVPVVGLRISTRAGGHPSRVGLLLALVLLTVAHLAGTVHASSFEGPHVSVLVAAHEQHGTNGDDRKSAPHPGHDHEADDHIDHAADRPRSVSIDDTILGPCPGLDGLTLLPVAGAGPAGTGGVSPRDPPGIPRSSYGPSPLALHCVWRQ